IYGLRRRILEGQDQRDYVLDLAAVAAESLIDTWLSTEVDPDEWDYAGLREGIRGQYGFVPDSHDGHAFEELGREEMKSLLEEAVPARYAEKEEEIGAELMRIQERYIMLHILDAQWKDHLHAMDHLKQGIGLRGYGQRNPLIEYKKESFVLFEEMWDRIERETVRLLFVLKAVRAAPAPKPAPVARRPLTFSGAGSNAGAGLAAVGAGGGGLQAPEGAPAPAALPAGGRLVQVKSGQKKVGRNDPCPCGSGKKYKKCHAA
ncbi:MAG: preprotein translocase subunit SecA, partial [Acidobacteria bacterium]|nr:preprotein translocase subunit SecA [Acidobacteriota bacterium]